MYGNSENGLSSFLLKPLLPLIKNYNTLYISTYGLLSNVNFNILAINDNEILEDKRKRIVIIKKCFEVNKKC